jgi:hypothetical protein
VNNFVSIFRVEEYGKKETIMKQAARIVVDFLWTALHYIAEDKSLHKIYL